MVNQIWITVGNEADDIHDIIHVLEHVHGNEFEDLEPLEAGNIAFHMYPHTSTVVSSLILGPRELSICCLEWRHYQDSSSLIDIRLNGWEALVWRHKHMIIMGPKNTSTLL